MEDGPDERVEELVHRVREHELSRSDFAKLLAGMGASATGIATLLASASAVRAAPAGAPHVSAAVATSHHHHQLHHQHVQRQAQATHPAGVPGTGTTSAVQTHRAQKLTEIMADYADTAIVEDPLFDGPIVGKRAIAERKMAEMVAMRGVTIEVVHRFAHKNQVVAEWIVRGQHQGPFLGYAPTGRSIEVRGMTVVTRKNAKIVKESLFYDLAELHRQLT